MLSGFGANQSAKKANRLAMIAQATTDNRNQALQQGVNQANADLGYDLLRRADGLPSFDQAAFTAAGDAAGFNRVTWLNSGALSLFDNRGEKTALVQQGYQMLSPGMTTYGTASQVQVPSMFSAFGDAVTAGTKSWMQGSQATAQLENQRTTSMANLISAVAQARAAGNGLAGLGTPAFSTAGSRITYGGGAAVAAGLGRAARGEALNDFGMKVKSPEFTSTGWVQGDPRMPDASAGMNRYGMITGEVMGLNNLVVDTYRRYFGPAAPDPATDRGWGGGRIAPPGWWQSLVTQPGALSPYRAPDMSQGMGYTYGD